MPSEIPTVYVKDASYTISALSQALAAGASLNEIDIDLSNPEHCRFGAYTLLQRIGGGGMGVVYRAHQTSLERDVAIKLLNIGKRDNTDALERFHFEAKSAAALNHPNIVQVLEIGQAQNVAFIAMQLVKGQTLADRISSERISHAEAVGIMQKLGDAVAYAHKLRLLHLDLKPANVLIDDRGEPLVADFGLARRMDERGQVQAIEVSGTPSYMAPEQLLINEFRLSASTDIYALGAILYEMLCGQRPHGRGDSAEVIQRVLAGDIPKLRHIAPRVSRDLEAICNKCLSLKPEHRYSSVEALREDLRRYQESLPVHARPLNPLQRLRRWARRKPAEAAIWLVLLGGIVITTNEMRSTEEARATADQQRQLAEAKSLRLKQSMALMATLFPSGDEKETSLQAKVDQLANWLATELPAQDATQAEILEDFSNALIAANKIDALDTMMRGVVRQMGTGYREQVIDELAKRKDAESLLEAALWSYAPDSEHPSRFRELIRRAIETAPNQALPLYVAEAFCSQMDDASPSCGIPEVSERLETIDRENAANWVAAITRQVDRDRQIWLAALGSKYDDHFSEIKTAYANATKHSGVPIPLVLAKPALVYSPSDPPEQTIGLIESELFKSQESAPVVADCDLPNEGRNHPIVRNSCIAVGKMMANAKGSLNANMAGSLILRRLSKGTDTDSLMRELRRQYLWADEQMKSITLVQRRRSTDAQLLMDIAQSGEFEAILRRLDRLGIARQPPIVWVPKDQGLLLPEERLMESNGQ